MERHRALFPGVALASLMIASLAACAAAQQLHPCIESHPAIAPPDPCADAPAAGRDACMAYVRQAFRSTVFIHASRYTAADGMSYGAGTGEVIDDHGTVLTAYHVVQDARLVVVGVRRLSDAGREAVRERDIPMTIAASVPELDVALLRPADAAEVARMPPPFVVRRDPATPGERLWHFGNVSFWSHGAVEAVGVTYDGTAGLTRVSFACRHGDSGGPFVDAQGRLVGVLLKKDGGEGEGHTFYMPVAAALDALGRR